MRTASRSATASLILLLTSQLALAECDFAKGIEKLPDGRYAYTVGCHKRVGKLVEDDKDKDAQVLQLGRVVELKDLSIQTQEKRAQLWMDTSLKLEDRVNQMDAMRSSSQWIYFGLGILTMAGAAWAFGQAARR